MCCVLILMCVLRSLSLHIIVKQVVRPSPMLLVIDYITPKQLRDNSMIGHYYTHNDRLRASLVSYKTIKEGTLFGIDLDTNIKLAKTYVPLQIQSPESLHNKDLNIGFSWWV